MKAPKSLINFAKSKKFLVKPVKYWLNGRYKTGWDLIGYNNHIQLSFEPSNITGSPYKWLVKNKVKGLCHHIKTIADTKSLSNFKPSRTTGFIYKLRDYEI